jgi:hypothetical protein
MSLSQYALAGLVEAIEAQLYEHPDDRQLLGTYADVLLKQGDPRSRLVEAQLRLERVDLAPDERKKLEGRARKLVKEHGRVWLGDLAPFLLDQEGIADGGEYRFEFAHGWLASVVVPELTVGFARALAAAPQARLLRELIVGGVREEEGVARFAALDALKPGLFLKNLRRFQLGHPGAGRKPRTWCLDGCEAVVHELLALMPRREHVDLPVGVAA